MDIYVNDRDCFHDRVRGYFRSERGECLYLDTYAIIMEDQRESNKLILNNWSFLKLHSHSRCQRFTSMSAEYRVNGLWLGLVKDDWSTFDNYKLIWGVLRKIWKVTKFQLQLHVCTADRNIFMCPILWTHVVYITNHVAMDIYAYVEFCGYKKWVVVFCAYLVKNTSKVYK